MKIRGCRLLSFTVTLALPFALFYIVAYFRMEVGLKTTQAESFSGDTLGIAVTGVTVTAASEIYGLAGPAPVNCSDPVYMAARATLDQQRVAWLKDTAGTLPGSVAIPSVLTGPSGATVSAPYLLTQPDGFAMTITPVDLAPAWGFASGAKVSGIPAFDHVQLNGSPSGCTMQDNAPRPSSSAGGDYYFNQLSNARGLNGLLFTFSTPVQAFGAFFGDVETSYRGTTAFLRLLDASGELVADLPISSTLGFSGGIGAENAVCDQSRVRDVHVAAQGLSPGCGNGSTRWIGFTSVTPIAQALFVVGDNDPLPDGRGFTEKLSVMGPTVVRVLPPAEVTIGKSAPPNVTTGTSFIYTLVVSNTSGNLATGVLVTDTAPAGVTFGAVTGSDCSLVAGTVTCPIGTLAAGTALTVLVQATANVTTTVTNTAFITATNDNNADNNIATTTVRPAAAPALNDCASPLSRGGPMLVINEVLYNEIGSNGDEWVELYVTTYIPGGTQFLLSDNESSSGGFNRIITAPSKGIPAGVYIVVHDDANVAGDDLDSADGVVELWDAGTSPTSNSLRNGNGDNLTLYSGATVVDVDAIDYMRYANPTVSDSTNDPPPSSVLWSGFAADNADNGQSVALIRNGHDGSSGSDWTLSGTSGTVSNATPGANNNGLPACNVAIAKTGPATGAIGFPFDYWITISNTANVTITGVVVTDTQPTGVVFNAVTGAGCNLADSGFTCTVGTLLPQATTIITVNATANQADVITNTAYTSAISDTIPGDNQASYALDFQRLGSIGDFVYLDANRTGVQEADEQRPIDDVTVTLHYPDGSVTTTVTIDGFYLFPHLPAGVYTVTVGNASGYELISTTAHVINLGAGQGYTQADFGFAYALANVRVTKAGDAAATVGDTLYYTLTVWNDSTTTPALDVVLTDTLPSGLTNVRVVDARCGVIDPYVFCNLNLIAPQTSIHITVTATAAITGNWLNAVAIDANNDLNFTDNAATLTTVILAPTPTATSTVTATDTPILLTATNTAMATETPVPPTTTRTPTATETPVPLPATRTATATDTPVLPTTTNTVTATDTSLPPTATNTATATDTPMPPTATNTATSTLVPTTATATDTPVPSTATSTATATDTSAPPTATNTATATDTPILLTATNTVTATETPVPPTTTRTPTATETSIPLPATHTATTTNTSVPLTATGIATVTDTPVPPTTTNTATGTATATDTLTPSTATATIVVTDTAVPPTAVNTATSTLVPTTTPTTDTPAPPAATSTATATDTPAPPTVTNTATATDTPVPPTATATTTVTDTAAPPTATGTATMTKTPAPTTISTGTATGTITVTNTTVPIATATATATNTATETVTLVPTLTPTATATDTPKPPVATSTATATHVPTLTPTATATNPATVTRVPTVTLTPTATATVTATDTPVPPTATSALTATIVATETPVPPTLTSTATATDTPLPPTVTHTATATATPVLPTATNTVIESATVTPVPTGPPVSTVIPTATATDTRMPPTATPTTTLVPTVTATTMATATLIPPTVTNTATATATTTVSHTPLPASTPTVSATYTPVLPTATSTATATRSATATATRTPVILSPTATLPAVSSATPMPSPTQSATAIHTPTTISSVTTTATVTPFATSTVAPPATWTPIATATASITATPVVPTVSATPTPTAPIGPSPTGVATPPLPIADLVLVKNALRTPIEPGSVITYTLTYSNVGFVSAQAIIITETVPVHTSLLLTHSTPGWACPAGTSAGAFCYFGVAQVAPQQRGELLYVVQVDNNLSTAAQIYNMAWIGAAAGVLEPRLENNSDALTISVSIPSALEEEIEPNRVANQIFLPLIAR